MRVDAHNDTALRLWDLPTIRTAPVDYRLQGQFSPQADLLRWQENFDIAFFAVYIDQEAYAGRYFAASQELFRRLKRDLAANSDIVRLVLRRDDVRKDPRLGVLLAIEGAECLGDNPELLRAYFHIGVRSLGFTHNPANALAGGCQAKGGFTEAGRRTARLANEIGIILDGAHLNEESFWDLLGISSQPVIISHTAAAALRPHYRNLSNEQLRAVAANGGVVGVTFANLFLADDADLSDYLRHLEHVAKVAGIDHVGIGSDFDGCDLPRGINSVSDMHKVLTGLKEIGFSDLEIAKIYGENFCRIMRKILPCDMAEWRMENGE